ncbi:hypothetical protein [Streptomyces sp. NPDC048436]|uniref:hypothetical protein n=1 Tax=Streptomyces sp. NPDC048436 TaxID=3365550 RepID=UPI00371585AC
MAEEENGMTGEGKTPEAAESAKSAKSAGSEGFTFTDWLEGAVILVMVGALVYKFVG